jgi:hypothetical protein
MIKKLLPALFAVLFASHAGAATLEGVTMPDSYPVDGKAIPLNGIGVRTLTIFSVKVYVAALYLAQPSHDADAIMKSPEDKVLILHFLHAGSKADVEKEYRAGETTNCGGGGCDPADATDFEKLVAAAPAVAVGDTTTYIFTPKSMRVLANNRQIGEYTNKDLARLILAGFIGAHPPSTELRSALLGLH